MTNWEVTKCYDSNLQDNPLQEVDPVWLYNRRKVSPQISMKPSPPYIIVKKINDLVYQIQLGPKCGSQELIMEIKWLQCAHLELQPPQS